MDRERQGSFYQRFAHSRAARYPLRTHALLDDATATAVEEPRVDEVADLVEAEKYADGTTIWPNVAPLQILDKPMTHDDGDADFQELTHAR